MKGKIVSNVTIVECVSQQNPFFTRTKAKQVGFLIELNLVWPFRLPPGGIAAPLNFDILVLENLSDWVGNLEIIPGVFNVFIAGVDSFERDAV